MGGGGGGGGCSKTHKFKESLIRISSEMGFGGHTCRTLIPSLEGYGYFWNYPMYM